VLLQNQYACTYLTRNILHSRILPLLSHLKGPLRPRGLVKFKQLLTTEAGDLSKVRMISVDVHDTVGARVVVSSNTVLLNIFPRCLLNSNVVEFQPLIAQRTVDVCPVVA